jgi:hypothetical protein
MFVILGIRYEFYSTVLNIKNILMVIFCYNVFKRRFDITQAIALSFLVVYMNN